LPAAVVFGAPEDEPDRSHLQACRATFTAGFTEPISATMLTPDHALIIQEENTPTLISESLWHSAIFSSRYVRNDVSTEWQWRIDTAWSATDVVGEPTFVCHHRFNESYFHWIMDCLPSVWLFREAHLAGSARWFLGSLDRRFHLPLLALYDIGPDQCSPFVPDRVVHFERAIVPAFQFVEPLKTRRPNFRVGHWNIGWSEEFLHDLRNRAHSRYGSRAPNDLKIYVSRSDADHRVVVNEAEIVNLLKEYGFTVVAPGEHSLAEQVELFGRARLIVGAHGAGLTNLVWARQNCTVLERDPVRLKRIQSS
jgi:capsular polysaccharide biosynthesis protein